jgi:LmbE family N-acetylglucosaminyl deacetylase
VRIDELQCSTSALGIHPPIVLGFPDGAPALTRVPLFPSSIQA